MRRLNLASVVMIAAIAALELIVPVLGLHDPVKMDILHRFAPPSAGHWLGQDEYGRDELSRLLWGGRISMSVAIGAAAVSCTLGVALDLIGGMFGAVAEFLTVRSMEALLCFPPLLLALLILTLLGPGGTTLIAVLAVIYLPGFVRIVHAGVISVRSQEYVEAMRVLGAGRLRIVLITILPNIAGPIMVQLSLVMASAVLMESGLSFLGLGIMPPASSWGLMIAAARSTMSQAPLLLLWPCLALSLTILVMNAVCDAWRDALDPHSAQRRGGLTRLLAPVPAGRSPVALRQTGVIAALEVSGLTIAIDTPAGPIYPVRDVSLRVAAGETLAVVGESGSGKSLMGLAVLGLLPAVARSVAGSIWLDGRALLGLDERALRTIRGRHIAIVFQDPLTSLNPVHRIGAQIAEAISAHARLAAAPARAKILSLLGRVGIPDPARVSHAYPHELSGGMRQRVMLAMAVAHDPRLLIADEPTTALDVTIQAQVLELIGRLKQERAMGVVFITHALPVVAETADRVAVMYAGEILEQGPAAAVLARPLHPYTAALLRGAPSNNGDLPQGIPGSIPAPTALPPGCVFAPRCAFHVRACDAAHPELIQATIEHATRCIRWQMFAHPEGDLPCH